MKIRCTAVVSGRIGISRITLRKKRRFNFIITPLLKKMWLFIICGEKRICDEKKSVSGGGKGKKIKCKDEFRTVGNWNSECFHCSGLLLCTKVLGFWRSLTASWRERENNPSVYCVTAHVNLFLFSSGRTRYRTNVRRRIRFRTSIAADVPRTGIKDERRLMTQSTAPMLPRCENELWPGLREKNWYVSGSFLAVIIHGVIKY